MNPRLLGGIGEKWGNKQYRQGNRVYDSNGVAMALTAQPVGNTGGNSYMYLTEEKSIVAMRGRNPNNPSDRTAGSPTEQRLEPNSQGLCNTLTSVQKDNLVMENTTVIIDDTQGFEDNPRIYNSVVPTLRSQRSGLKTIEQYRIRKLTPKECWRLMDFTDEDFEKSAAVNSQTQLYKQAGNSIVVNVLVAILGQMLPDKEDIYKTRCS